MTTRFHSGDVVVTKASLSNLLAVRSYWSGKKRIPKRVQNQTLVVGDVKRYDEDGNVIVYWHSGAGVQRAIEDNLVHAEFAQGRIEEVSL